MIGGADQLFFNSKKMIKLILLNTIMWGSIHFLVSYIFLRLNNRAYFSGPLRLKTYTFERNGNIWNKLFHVHKWKNKVPEGGQIFTGSYNKSELRDKNPAALKSFIAEINRAEITHWTIIFSLPLIFIFNPRWTYIIHGSYALLSNMPFIIIQRYNRPRFERLYARQLKRDDLD